MDEWIDAEKELPKEDDIYRVKLANGDEIRAYFYADKIGWIAYYGKRTSYWWSEQTNEALFNVIEWKRKANI